MKKNPGRKDRRDFVNRERHRKIHKHTTSPKQEDKGSRLKMMGLSKPKDGK